MHQINDDEARQAVDWIGKNTMPFLTPRSHEDMKLTNFDTILSHLRFKSIKHKPPYEMNKYVTIWTHGESIDFQNLVIIDGKTRAGYLKFRYRHYSTLPGDLREALMVWFRRWWGV